MKTIFVEIGVKLKFFVGVPSAVRFDGDGLCLGFCNGLV